MKIPFPPLLVITDRKLAGEDRLFSVVENILRAGCRWIMVREKDLTGEELRQIVCPIVNIAGQFNATVVVNSDLETALSCKASGVHLPWNMVKSWARRVKSSRLLLGISTHSLEEALEAERYGADYITLSPIFNTVSGKPSTTSPLGLAKLSEVAGRVSIPVIALGGITWKNARLCIDAGAAGVAVLGSIMLSPNPEKTFREILENMLNANPASSTNHQDS